MHSSAHRSLIVALAEGDAASADVTIDQVRCAPRAMVVDALPSSASLLHVEIGIVNEKECCL